MSVETSEASLQRSFAVHDAAESAVRAHLVEGLSFEDAALHFIADWSPGAADDEVSVIVEDCETGERRCFRVDLDTGATAPCE